MNLREFINGHLNVPYKWGGTTTSGFDCSGWVNFIYAEFFKKPLSARSTSQMLSTFKEIDRSELAIGDLVFFNTIKGPEVDHVGLYLGNNEFTHAGSKGTTVANLTSTYWKKAYVTSRKIG